MKLSIQLVVKNNAKTLEATLESLLPLNGRIVVADLGCRDDSIRICSKYGAEVTRLSLNDDCSDVRNRLARECKEDWSLVMEPWETIMRGHTAILETVKGPPKSCRFSVLQGDIITKQVRLWHKSRNLRFINPVYETVIDDSAQDSPVYLHSVGGGDQELTMSLVKKWRERSPLAVEPIYYEACTLLVQKKWKEFLNVASHYIHLEKKQKMSLTMCRYYCAMVLCYVTKDYQQALNVLLPCLADKPTMSEFWCLLGDIYYAAKQYEKAITFYENGTVLGSRRLKSDDWPFDITKYKDYPADMIAACRKMLEVSKRYTGVSRLPQGRSRPQ